MQKIRVLTSESQKTVKLTPYALEYYAFANFSSVQTLEEEIVLLLHRQIARLL